MARISLTRLDDGGLRYANAVDRSGQPGVLPFYRLLLSLYFLPPDADDSHGPVGDLDEQRTAETILDTSAPLTILPFDVWQPLTDEIRWLQPAGVRWPALALAGGRWSYRVGRVRAGALDAAGRWLPAAWTPAMCLDDHDDSPRWAFIGVQSALLARRRIRNAGAAGDESAEWWLEDNWW